MIQWFKKFIKGHKHMENDETTVSLLQKRISDIILRRNIIASSIVELTTKSARNSAPREIYQQSLFELKVEETKLQAEYFVIKDFLNDISN